MQTVILIALLVAAPQQPAPASPAVDRTTMSGSAAFTYNGIKGFILKSAEKMPAEHFAFQPTPEVRSFGQVLAHIADGNYLLCSSPLGEANPNGTVLDKIEKENLAREPLIAKLQESFAFCDRAYAGLTDANASETVPFMTSKRPRVSLLWFHIAHAYEHYGNLVTYMRLKGIVPPSTARQ